MNYINGSELTGKKFVRLENGDLWEVKRGKFVPEDGEGYWFINEFGMVHHISWSGDGDSADRWIAKHSHIFATREDCEEYKHYLEALDKYTFKPDWSNPDQKKWELCYNHETKSISYSSTVAKEQYGKYYFPSKRNITVFIAEVGEDAVECFMFDIWR